MHKLIRISKRNFLIHAIIAITIISCGNEKKTASENEFVINAYFSSSRGEMLYLYELNVNDKVLIDSAIVDENGNFFIKHNLNETGFYILHEKGNNFITLLTAPGETVNLKADIRQLVLNSQIEGSPGSELLIEFENFTRNNHKKVEKLSFIIDSSKHSKRFLELRDSLDNEFRIILNEQKVAVKDFIKKNHNSLASLIAINRRFREHTVLSETEDFAYFDLLDKSLSIKHPGNKHVLDHHDRVTVIRKEIEEAKKAAERLAIGKPAPIFRISSDKGELLSIEDFRGKIIVLYFWASWNASSRQTNIHLGKIYKKHKKKNFAIIGVSLDSVNDIWRAAIKLDKLEWVQLNDLSGWDSPIVKEYNVKKLPQLTLIDKEGKIIGHNLKISEIENALDDILK